MRTVASTLLITLGLCLPAFAQDKPKADAKKTDEKKPAAKADEKKAAEKKPAKKKAEFFNDPAKAMPDISVYGEYEGEIAGKGKLGAQVVPLGEGKFDAWFFPGGLPGAGGTAKSGVRVAGKLGALSDSAYLVEIGNVLNPAGGWSGTLEGFGEHRLRGKTPEGVEFTLRKTVRKSPTQGAAPPEGAIVLFDGTQASLAHWAGGKIVEGDLLLCGTQTKRTFGDHKLHMEFRTPFCFRSLGRSNSGVFPGEFYEVQIMDSFGVAPGGRGEKYECGAGYGVAAPGENVTYPALQWQTFDIEFRMPRFDEAGKKTANARMTVIHNGVKVQDNLEFPAGTNGRPDAKKPAPILLQNHGSPTVFRNVWVVEVK